LKRFVYIDVLRGYAVLGALFVHCSQYVGFDCFAAFGARGVQLFFVVSALTLMASWHSRADGVTAFFLRRVFRIVPMYWLTILIYTLVLPYVHGRDPRFNPGWRRKAACVSRRQRLPQRACVRADRRFLPSWASRPTDTVPSALNGRPPD
jgi:acyltransferase-like protein